MTRVGLPARALLDAVTLAVALGLFIDALTFTDGLHGTETELGVLGGSLLSGIFGAVLLMGSAPRASKR